MSNDRWIVSGVMMFFLLYFLKASTQQEKRNVQYIQKRLPHLCELLELNQVLSILEARSNPLVKCLYGIIWPMPTLLYAYLLYLDIDSRKVGYIFVGVPATEIQLSLEGIVVLLVVYMNVSCLRIHLELRKLIADIDRDQQKAGRPVP